MKDQELNYKLIAERLWNLLDDIDTAFDHYKPNMDDRFVHYVDCKIRERGLYANSIDGQTLQFNKEIPILENDSPMVKWFKDAWKIEKGRIDRIAAVNMAQIPESIAKQPIDPDEYDPYDKRLLMGNIAISLLKKVWYHQEMTELIAKNASALDLAKCLKKHFVSTPYFKDQLYIQKINNHLMLSSLGNPTESEMIEAREIEKILSEIKND